MPYFVIIEGTRNTPLPHGSFPVVLLKKKLHSPRLYMPNLIYVIFCWIAQLFHDFMWFVITSQKNDIDCIGSFYVRFL